MYIGVGVQYYDNIRLEQYTKFCDSMEIKQTGST